MLCNKPYMAMLCCPITEILVQLIDFIIRLLVYEGSIEKLLIYAHYRAKPCLHAFFCNIIHLYDWAYLAFVFCFLKRAIVFILYLT